MTVLRRNDVRGFESKRTRNFLVGLAVVVVGLAAAFGIGQLITDDAMSTGSPVATLQSGAAERGAAMQANIDALTRNGLAQQQAMQAQALDQVSAVQSRGAFEKAIGATTWTVEDEIAAIHGRTGTEPTSNVGATVSQPTTEQALAGLHGRTGTRPTANVGTATYQPTAAQEQAAIEARTGVVQGAVSGELGWSAKELAEFHARNGFEPKPYAEQLSGPK